MISFSKSTEAGYKLLMISIPLSHATALSRFNGHCTLFWTSGHFLTMTTNLQWPEITQELLLGQTAYDRPELVSQVFQMKKKAIINFIYKHGIFGSAVAYVYTIKFQKQGLPHMHILIFLKEPYKLNTTQAIDSCIWA